MGKKHFNRVKQLLFLTQRIYFRFIHEVKMSYRQIYYQIVFGTKFRNATIPDANCTQLYAFINGVIKNRNCKLYRINGTEDHIHIFSDLHPSICLSDLVKEIKTASSVWLKANPCFPGFEGWQLGYGAFTYSIRERDMIINYVKKQKEHHRSESFFDEFRRLLTEHGIEFDEKYLL